jgi:hypothetical protein
VHDFSIKKQSEPTRGRERPNVNRPQFLRNARKPFTLAVFR